MIGLVPFSTALIYFGEWLAYSTLPALPRDELNAKSLLRDVYIPLYCLAGHLLAKRLKKEIMEMILIRKYPHRIFYDKFVVERVYATTRPGSRLRSFVVDAFIFGTKLKSSVERLQVLRDHDQHSKRNQKFVGDCDDKKTYNMLHHYVGQDPYHKPKRVEYLV